MFRALAIIGLAISGAATVVGGNMPAVEPEFTGVFRVLGWDRGVADLKYVATAEQPARLDVPNGAISPQYAYTGPAALRFYQNLGQDNQPAYGPYATVKLPKGKNMRVLLLFHGTEQKPEVLLADASDQGFTEHALRFINLSKRKLEIWVGENSAVLNPRGSVQLLPEDTRNTTIRILSDAFTSDDLIYSSRWRPRDGMQLIVFIVPADGDDSRLLVRRFREAAHSE